jgi:site-specific DNA-methyltransferase (adenine-specific)
MPTYSDGELAYCSKINSIRSYKYAWHGMIQGDMKNKEQRIHPTQKPVKLYQWLLKNYAEPGQCILDTHLGSGSSAIAAHYFGVDFVGLEIDEDYFKAAKQRFDQETRQKSMFDYSEFAYEC